MTEHTALPWKAGYHTEGLEVCDALLNQIALITDNNIERARFIVTACNCHAELTAVAEAANDLWALFCHNPDEIPYGDEYEEETTRLHQLLGEKLREYSAVIRYAEEQPS